MPTNAPAPTVIWNFLKEIFQRLFSKSPTFFKVFSWISAIAFLITGLPGIMEELGIVLPESLTALQSKIIGWASAISFFMSKLPVSDPANLPMTTHTPISTTDAKK